MNNLFDGPYAVVVRVQHLLRRLIAHPTIPLSEFKLELNEWVDGTSARQVLEWANHLLKLKSRLTVIAYLRAILPVLMEFSDIPILEWQREQITFIRHLNRNVRTQRHRLDACQSLIRFVEKQTKTPFIRWRVWHSARPRIRMRNMAVMTEAQLHEVVGYLYQRKRCGEALVVAALLASFWGLRASEIAAVTCGDVLLVEHITLVVQGKRGKHREIPALFVPRDIAKHIEQWWSLVYRGDASAPLIGLPVRDLERRIKRAMKMVGLQPRSGQAADSLHHLRHWYANRLYLNGLPVSEIARLLGHSSPSTTMGSYLHVLGTPHIKTMPTIETDETVRYTVLATWCGVSDKHLRNLLRLQVGQNYTQGHVPISVAFVFLDGLLDGQHSTPAPRWGDHAPSDFSND